MNLQLPTKKTERDLNIESYIWLIYGEPKIGKTTLAASMPGAFFIATEPGHRYQEIYKVDVTSWEEIMDVQKLLTEETHRYKTIVVDTVSFAMDLIADYVLRMNNEDDLNGGKLSYGKGYKQVRFIFNTFVNSISARGLGVVMICHEFLKDSSFKGIERSKYQINLSKSSRDCIVPVSDFIGRMFWDGIEEDGKIVDKRVISFQGCREYEAGDRTGILAEKGVIPLSGPKDCWNDIAVFFKKKTTKSNMVTSG